MHIPPGLMYVEQIEQFWKNDSQTNLTTLLGRYQHKILMTISGHIHTADIRAPVSFNNTALNMTVLLAPSVSPFH